MPWPYVHAYLAILAALLVGWHATTGAIDKAAVAAACCAYFTAEACGYRVLGRTAALLRGRR